MINRSGFNHLNVPAKNGQAITVGLRVDVDTFRGTRDGVPGLLKILTEARYTGDIFFQCRAGQYGQAFVAAA